MPIYTSRGFFSGREEFRAAPGITHLVRLRTHLKNTPASSSFSDRQGVFFKWGRFPAFSRAAQISADLDGRKDGTNRLQWRLARCSRAPHPHSSPRQSNQNARNRPRGCGRSLYHLMACAADGRAGTERLWHQCPGTRGYRSAAIRVTRKITMKMKNKMRATPAAADATPPKPNTPATNAMAANTSAHRACHSPEVGWPAARDATAETPQTRLKRTAVRFCSERPRGAGRQLHVKRLTRSARRPRAGPRR